MNAFRHFVILGIGHIDSETGLSILHAIRVWESWSYYHDPSKTCFDCGVPVRGGEGGMMSRRVGHFMSKIAGVTHDYRQDLLPRLHRHDTLRLERQESNPYDSNAVAIYNPHGQQLGFVPKETAAGIASDIDAGKRFACFVWELTGGTRGHQTYGCNILIVWAAPGVSDAEVAEHLRSMGLDAHVPNESTVVRTVREVTASQPLDGRGFFAVARKPWWQFWG